MLVSKSALLLGSLALCGAIDGALGFAVPALGLARSKSSFIPKQEPSACCRAAGDYRLARRAQEGLRGLTATIPVDLEGRERLEQFLDDCVLLGPVRFVCVTDAAILETVGSFDNLRFSDLSNGRYATVSEVGGFECHLNTDKIKTISMVTKPSPGGQYDLYITRFLDEKGDTVLSAILHGNRGLYEPGAADYWKKLRKNFGAEQTVA